MTFSIPKKPKGVVFSPKRLFGDCRYVYVRFEDHSVDEQAHPDVVRMMDEMKAESDKRVAEGGSAIFSIIAEPWLAEQLYRYANCALVGERYGSSLPVKKSRYFNKVREGSELV